MKPIDELRRYCSKLLRKECGHPFPKGFLKYKCGINEDGSWLPDYCTKMDERECPLLKKT